MHSMKIIFKNLGKLVLKIEIDLGGEPKMLSKMDRTYVFILGLYISILCNLKNRKFKRKVLLILTCEFNGVTANLESVPSPFA